MKSSAFLFALLLACMVSTELRAGETVVIKNGGMMQGDDLPDEWEGKFGNVQVARDTRIFKKGPASLRVTVTNGKGGSAFQKIDGGADAKLNITGWIRSQGNVKVQVAIHAFAEGFKQNQFIPLGHVQGDMDWAQFEEEVQLPEWTAFFSVLLMVEGDGSAWLDEVREDSGAVDTGTLRARQKLMTSAPPPKGKPWEPGWGFYSQFPTMWQDYFQSQLEHTKKKEDAKVVFIGDSITQGWKDAGDAAWTQHFEPLGAVNYGVGGDSTRQVLWRIENGLLDGLHPKLVVLEIGTNNLHDDRSTGTDEEIARGIETVVKTIRKKVPQARVLLLGILPRQNEYYSSRVQHINNLIAKLDDRGKQVRFLDIGNRFQSIPGKGDVHEELFTSDKLHLDADGYNAFAEAIKPAVTELMEGRK